MSEQKIEKILNNIKTATAERDNWTSRWEDCYDYALPNRTGFFNEMSGEDKTDKIFDSTAVQSTQEFASRMQAGLTPPFAKWFELKAGSDVEKKLRQDVDAQLEEIAEYVWEVLQNSNLDQELHEGYIDLAVGTGSLLVEEGDELQPIKFTAVPQPQLIMTAGPFGALDNIYRQRQLTVDAILTLWPKAEIPKEMKAKAKDKPNEKFSVVECVEKDWKKKGDETYVFTVISSEPKSILFESEFKGFGSNPWIPFRWSKAAGETYGRGPLLNAMPDVRTLNMVTELVLDNADMAITGMWQADDDGTINPDTIELVPGTVIPKAPTSAGLQPLGSPGNFDVGQFVMKDMRHNIRKALFNEQLGSPEGTPMSAAEVHTRMADLARTIGSAYGRLHNELVTPLLRRVVYILKKQGRINVPMINGREVKVINTSPLAQAQHNENVARVARWTELANASFGPQVTNTVIKAEEALKYTAKEIGVPESLVRTDAEREELAEAIAATQQTPNVNQTGGV